MVHRWLIVLALLACRAAGGFASAAEKPLVFVGLPPQRWLVRQLAGERVEIGLLLGPGQNPHTFEPAARQVTALARADLYLMLGLPFERAVVRKAQAVHASLQVCEMAAGIPRRNLSVHAQQHAAGDDDDGCSEGADPHVWLTPGGMAIMASNTVAALTARDPAGRVFYAARLQQVVADLTRLDADLRTLLAPVRGGMMLTYHASWGYFAEAYGLRQVSIEAEGRAPAARQLATLIDLAQREKVRRVFTEPPYDPRPAQTLARQIGAEVVVVDPLAEDWDTNLRAIAAQVRTALTAVAPSTSRAGE